ncbi:uncharacterized protein LOC143464453 [Clavelina lepadiformis]|uniref:FHA domain-containing protein n=1 Tax=Clavelina lepadiformis TaxID=159417 RepID=A0ABP0F3B1_CLALP
MPKQVRQNISDSEEYSGKHKKHKKEKEIHDSEKTKRKPKQYASDLNDSSPDVCKHSKQHDPKEERRRCDISPEMKRRHNYRNAHKSEARKTSRSPDERSRKRLYRDDNRDRHRDIDIKKEEDFDRRQEELSRRRRDRPYRQHRPDIHVKQERHDRGYSRSRNADRNERGRHDDQRREEWERRQRTGETEKAFKNDEEKPTEKEKPNLGLSGALTEDTNTFRGVVIKYNEPPEARIPKKKWRLYPFKGTEALKTLHLHRQSAFLLGRQRRIADIPVDHPSCSKQHAVLQFRMIEEETDGVLRRKVKPYIIDLAAANGTYVNNEKIEAQRYVELKEQDVLKFGFSSREYVLLHDKSDTSVVDDESGAEDEED